MKKKLSLLFLGIIPILEIHASEPLDSVFDSLRNLPGVTAVNVRYTGTFDGRIQGFMYHRGTGNGWTKGTRVSCPDVTPEMAEAIFDVFDRSASEVGHITRLETDRACCDDSNMIGYACHYNNENGSLQFLRATVEDQICIPHDWYERDFFDGSVGKDQPQLRAEEWVAALASLHTELKYNYVFYDRFKEEIDSAYRVLLPQMLQVTDNYDGFRLMERFIASCHDGHTYVYDSGVIELSVNAPFTTKLIDGRVYVDRVESSALDSAGMKRGSEIIMVNGIPAKQYADSLLCPYVSSSTPQWTDFLVYDRYGFSKGRKGESMVLTLKEDNRYKEINFTRGNMKKDIPSMPYKFTFNKIQGNIGVLKIPDFQSSTVTEMFDGVYDEIMATDALIIDIRGNGGGNSGYADYIARHFSADSILTDSWRTPIYSPAFASWGHDRSWYESPSRMMAPVTDKEPYLKPVVILIDRGTFSAAEDFAALFKGMKRATFVGTPTGGSTGNGVRVQLNRLVSANICSKHDCAPDGSEFVGIGIQPDIIVEETTDAYFSSMDPFISVALSHMNSTYDIN